jgi:hypothetical protein
MLLRDYLPTNCSTSGIAGLARQIADTLLAGLPQDKVIDVSSHVTIAGGSTHSLPAERSGGSIHRRHQRER